MMMYSYVFMFIDFFWVTTTADQNFNVDDFEVGEPFHLVVGWSWMFF